MGKDEPKKSKKLTKEELEKKKEEEDLSDEDKQLKEELELCVTRLTESQDDLWVGALDTLTTLIRASTTSMTSVPKPLKFMNPHFETMKGVYEKMPGSHAAKLKCADVVSVLAMTMSEERECLKYKMMGNTSTEEIELWGHEYVRHLSGEVVNEYNNLDETDAQFENMKSELVELAKKIVPSQMKHN